MTSAGSIRQGRARYCGVTDHITFQHILVASIRILFKKWQPSMVISSEDFRDRSTISLLPWAFEQPARCDRYDYKQKFEYWVLSSGPAWQRPGCALVPTLITRLLPGQFIPSPRHCIATRPCCIPRDRYLAYLQCHLQPGSTALDTVIFTGKISGNG